MHIPTIATRCLSSFSLSGQGVRSEMRRFRRDLTIRGLGTADRLEFAGKWSGNEGGKVARRRWARGGIAILLHGRVCWKVERTGFEKRD